MNIYDRIVKIAIVGIEKRAEETFFLDWNSQFLRAIRDYLSDNHCDSDTFIQADKITTHVIEEVKPSFRIRTESLGRILDRESILIERRVRWFKDEKGNLIHKTGWRLDVKRLTRKVSKFHMYIQSKEEFKKDEGEKIVRDIEKNDWGKLSDEESRHRLAEVGKPRNWKDWE
jgi:hypothetical protein